MKVEKSEIWSADGLGETSAEGKTLIAEEKRKGVGVKKQASKETWGMNS